MQVIIDHANENTHEQDIRLRSENLREVHFLIDLLQVIKLMGGKVSVTLNGEDSPRHYIFSAGGEIHQSQETIAHTGS